MPELGASSADELRPGGGGRAAVRLPVADPPPRPPARRRRGDQVLLARPWSARASAWCWSRSARTCWYWAWRRAASLACTNSSAPTCPCPPTYRASRHGRRSRRHLAGARLRNAGNAAMTPERRAPSHPDGTAAPRARLRARWRLPLLATAQAPAALTTTPAAGGGTTYSLTIQTLMLMTPWSFIPALVLMTTCFTRIVIVFLCCARPWARRPRRPTRCCWASPSS